MKNAVISAQILALVERGASLKNAIDRVLGPGSYDVLVSDVYDALRKEG